jgi:GLPGLI family protein
MKNIIFFTILFTINYNYYSQTYKSGVIKYVVDIDNNLDANLKKTDSISFEVKNKLDNINDDDNRIVYILKFENNYANFFKENSFSKKSLKSILSGKGFFFTNLEENEIIVQKESFGELFLIDTKAPVWTYHQETKVIGNYKCYKATSKREIQTRGGIKNKTVTAWYTNEIPIRFGIKNYIGLPGLTIELNDGYVNFKAFKVLLDNEPKKIKTPQKGKKVNEKEYNDIIKKMFYEFRNNRN